MTQSIFSADLLCSSHTSSLLPSFPSSFSTSLNFLYPLPDLQFPYLKTLPYLLFISVQRQSLSASINTAIQRSLHAGTADPESLLCLLDLYSACLTHSAQTSRTNGAQGVGGKDGVGDEYATMSIPALLTWVREEACGSSSSSSYSSSSSSLRPEVCHNT